MVERWWVARESGDDAVLYAYARDAVRVLNGLPATTSKRRAGCPALS